MSLTTQSIRNIVLCGHGSTGKTTLTEQILFNGGAIPKAEYVETGKTVSDYTDEEIARKVSIHVSLSTVTWNNFKINIFDTPGIGDFMGETISAFRAAECAVVLVGADVGVQIETIKIWRRLNTINYPRIIFINKMEKEHADFDKALADLSDKFKVNFVPVIVPVGKGKDFKGVIDLLQMKAFLHVEGKKAVAEDIPADLQPYAQEMRERLVEAAAEGDDALIEKFFAEGNLSNEEIDLGLRKGIMNNKVFPVCSGAGLENNGVHNLLDFITHAAPAPYRTVKAVDSKGNETECTINADGPVQAFVFKTSIDQFSGKLSFIKVISGKLLPDGELINTRGEKKEKTGKLYTAVGKKHDETDMLIAGDVGVLHKLNTAETNDSLCQADAMVSFTPLALPQPVHSVAITAVSKKDEDKLNQLLLRAAEEDLTFSVKYNKETKETVVSCMGELQLNIILDKIKDKQKIEIETKVPKVPYRETIQAQAGAEYAHKKQTGGHGQYAKVVIEIAPIARGEQFKFVNAIFGGAVSKGYIPGVEKGILEGMEHGILAGYPIVDIEAKIVDGKEHPVDSSEMAFKLAARGALKDAMEKAKPVLLEPVANLTVYVDDTYLGDILSDISSRRGKVLGQEPIGGGILEVRSQVPQAELLRYSIDLKAITSGTASFEMEFDHYSPITGKIAEDVIKAAEQMKEEAHA
ncbi:MAG: elongation factor G [Spirochaetales bacterium]|nr:elongation factor G [Spirochaetales bacterium]